MPTKSMKASTPVRIDSELYAEAESVAEVMSRSTTQQIAHWARIGRELEASPTVSMQDVAAVLGNKNRYDTLGEDEQAIVRASWAERLAALSGSLRLDQDFAAEGRPFVELDDEGRVVRRDPEKAQSGGASMAASESR